MCASEHDDLDVSLAQEGGVLDPSKQQLALAAGPSAAGMAKALQMTGAVAPTKAKKAGTKKGGESVPDKARYEGRVL